MILPPKKIPKIQSDNSTKENSTKENAKENLVSAISLLRELISQEEFQAYDLNTSPNTVYSNLFTLWLISLQRLGENASLAAAVKDLQSRHSDLLPNHKRVREGTLSERTGSFSRARKRLSLETTRQFATDVINSLIKHSPPWLNGQLAFIIDGTTITLEPTSELQRLYPPATNQLGETVWPVLMLLVAHELQSGCALLPELGAKYGNDNTSESKQAMALAQRLPPNSLVLADANFGIFNVAYAMHKAGHKFLFRLQKSRFKALMKHAARSTVVNEAGTIRNVVNEPTCLMWRPSARDRRSNPDLPHDAQLEVMVHETTLPSGEIMYLVTSLQDLSTAEASEAYHRRYDVEFDIRDLKVTLGLEKMRAKTSDMMQKELLCGLVAYNLVQCLRREGAKQAQVAPRRLSFKNTLITMQIMLLPMLPSSYEEWQKRYERAVKSVASGKLPIRPNRNFERKAHSRRAKSTNEQRHKKTKPDLLDDPEKPK